MQGQPQIPTTLVLKTHQLRASRIHAPHPQQTRIRNYIEYTKVPQNPNPQSHSFVLHSPTQWPPTPHNTPTQSCHTMLHTNTTIQRCNKQSQHKTHTETKKTYQQPPLAVRPGPQLVHQPPEIQNSHHQPPDTGHPPPEAKRNKHTTPHHKPHTQIHRALSHRNYDTPNKPTQTAKTYPHSQPGYNKLHPTTQEQAICPHRKTNTTHTSPS